MARNTPDPTMVCSPLRLPGVPPLAPDAAFRAAGLRQAVPTQGSFAREALPSVSATTSPCADPTASRCHFAHRAYRRARAGCAIPGWSVGPSRFGSALLSWSAVPSTPAAGRVRLTSTSPPTSAFAHLRRARRPQVSPTNGFPWGNPFDAAGIPYCYGPPVCSPSWPFGTAWWQHPRAFPFELAADSLPPRQSRDATRPTGQLPGLVLHQQEEQPLSAAPKIWFR